MKTRRTKLRYFCLAAAGSFALFVTALIVGIGDTHRLVTGGNTLLYSLFDFTYTTVYLFVIAAFYVMMLFWILLNLMDRFRGGKLMPSLMTACSFAAAIAGFAFAFQISLTYPQMTVRPAGRVSQFALFGMCLLLLVGGFFALLSVFTDKSLNAPVGVEEEEEEEPTVEDLLNELLEEGKLSEEEYEEKKKKYLDK